ncbi:hypothetical protein [Isoptericola croceus]|uniref:hypothetical protein n=1 Tax=Isoptericola croceus TaxID=3031406 RepID=UPI0023F73A88|nr:hypothetical protein [Isoptericola croceus]
MDPKITQEYAAAAEELANVLDRELPQAVNLEEHKAVRQRFDAAERAWYEMMGAEQA